MYWSGAAPAGTSFFDAISIYVHTRSWSGAGSGQALGFAGALVMLLAAYISAFSLWAGRCIAALALMLIAAFCLCENIGMYPRLLNIEVALVLALVLASAFYVAGSFRVVALNPLYPRKASPAGKWVVAAFIAAPSVCFVWWAFWHEAAHMRSVVVPASWEPVALDRVTSGRRQMKFSFTAQDSSAIGHRGLRRIARRGFKPRAKNRWMSSSKKPSAIGIMVAPERRIHRRLARLHHNPPPSPRRRQRAAQNIKSGIRDLEKRRGEGLQSGTRKRPWGEGAIRNL